MSSMLAALSTNRIATPSFQYMSDLHLEVGQQYTTFEIEPEAPYLILAGDIGRLIDYEKLLRFLQVQCERFTLVFFVLGNHEFYGTSRPKGLELAASLEKEPVLEDRLRLLQKTRVDIPDSNVIVLGCTLQSYIVPEAQDDIKSKVQDFRQIQEWSVEDHNREHELDIQYLKETAAAILIEEPSKQIIIITHHAPIIRGTSKPKDVGSALTSAFATDILPKSVRELKVSPFANVKVWIFGHTHYTTDFRVAGVRVIANQRGYVLNGVSLEGSRPTPGLWQRIINRPETNFEFDPHRLFSL